MPEATVTAIVLRRSDLGESDRRLVLLTRELGKIEVIAKGARKSGSRLAAASEPLSLAEIHLAAGRVRRYVTQAQPMSSLRSLRTDYDRLMNGLAMAELVSEHLPYEVPNPEVFDRLTRALASLTGQIEPTVPLVWFASWLLKEEGQMPDWNLCAVTGAPIRSKVVCYSPAARGSLAESQADKFVDRRQTTSEALKGIAMIAELEAPPSRLKRSAECSAVLFRMWQGIVDAALPAWEAAVRSSQGNGE